LGHDARCWATNNGNWENPERGGKTEREEEMCIRWAGTFPLVMPWSTRGSWHYVALRFYSEALGRGAKDGKQWGNDGVNVTVLLSILCGNTFSKPPACLVPWLVKEETEDGGGETMDRKKDGGMIGGEKYGRYGLLVSFMIQVMRKRYE